MVKDQATAKAECIKLFQEAIAELKPLENEQGYILAWDNGLGVRFVKGDACVCSIAHAEIIGTDAMPEEAWAYVPNVKNGKGEAAAFVRMGTAVKREIAQYEKWIAQAMA